MKKPLLTIGIPTWNRCEDIKVAIDSVLSQLTDDLYSQIEILVSDNGSTDATQSVLAEYDIKYPDLFSISRNIENIGFYRNVDMLFRKSKGEFVLVLSDDDALEPDAIPEILFVLKKHSDINIMFVRVGLYDRNLSGPKDQKAWIEARNNKGSDHSCVYYSSGIKYYVANKSFCNVCISGNLYRVSAWKSINMDAGLQSGSVHLHAAVQIHAKGSSCVINRPLIKYRVEAGSFDDYLNVRNGGYKSGFPFIYHFDIVKACRDGRLLYPPHIYRAFYLTCVRGVFYTLLDVKANNIPINKDFVLARLTECFDPDYCCWLIRLFRCLLEISPVFFVVPNYLYHLGQKAYFGISVKKKVFYEHV